jgi:hypothetical protein
VFVHAREHVNKQDTVLLVNDVRYASTLTITVHAYIGKVFAYAIHIYILSVVHRLHFPLIYHSIKYCFFKSSMCVDTCTSGIKLKSCSYVPILIHLCRHFYRTYSRSFCTSVLLYLCCEKITHNMYLPWKGVILLL